eukprot:5938058-Pyramimonas_sp.AAC.1
MNRNMRTKKNPKQSKGVTWISKAPRWFSEGTPRPRGNPMHRRNPIQFLQIPIDILRNRMGRLKTPIDLRMGSSGLASRSCGGPKESWIAGGIPRVSGGIPWASGRTQ